MPRRVEIGPEAMRVMAREFAQQKPPRMIAGIVERETGERITVRTVERRAAAWRADQTRIRAGQEQADALVKAFRANDFTASEMIQALATQQLIEHPDGFAEADPIAVQRHNLRAEELRVKAEALRLKEREVAVAERRLEALLEKQQRADAEAAKLQEKAGRGEQITPEQLQRIRDLYQ